MSTLLLKQLSNVQATLQHAEKQHNAVSAANVGWHIDHILLTVLLIVKATKNADPTLYKPSFKLFKTIVLLTGKIPRGKAKAPKLVTPNAVATTQMLVEKIELAKNYISELNGLHKNNYFEHPYFGHLNVKPTIKFLGIHTNHHLKIINDIIKATT